MRGITKICALAAGGLVAAVVVAPSAFATAQGAGDAGYCSNNHVSLSTRTTAGAVAHVWDTGYQVSWYNSATTTRTSGVGEPYASYGYSTAGSLLSLTTGC